MRKEDLQEVEEMMEMHGLMPKDLEVIIYKAKVLDVYNAYWEGRNKEEAVVQFHV